MVSVRPFPPNLLIYYMIDENFVLEQRLREDAKKFLDQQKKEQEEFRARLKDIWPKDANKETDPMEDLKASWPNVEQFGKEG